jgi:predicted  nucleic acid-binding Zn-ribbon protein
MKLSAIVLVTVVALASGCATTEPETTPVSNAPPPDLRLVQQADPEPSPIAIVDAARKEAAELRELTAKLEEQVASLASEKEALLIQLRENDRRLEDLEAAVRRATRREQELTDALLASEIQKATFERRLLEQRLVELREGGQ